MSALPSAPAQSTNTAQSLREVRRGVAQAGDAQVLQVVRMVDALEVRGATDAVLDPVRSRLRAIQPARPLRFARLLFMPLDPLIVPPKAWRAGTPFLPRTALMVLSRVVRVLIQQTPAQADSLTEVDALIAGATTAQTSIVRKAGGLLWPKAAAALRVLGEQAESSASCEACRSEWVAEGLAVGELRPICLALAPILAQATALHDHDHAGATLTDETLLEMLAATEANGPRASGMMLSLLVIRVPQAAPALLAAAQTMVSLRAMVETAAETALDWIETETADQAGSIGDAAPLEMARHAALLEALANQPGGSARRRRLAEARTHLLEGSLHRFDVSLQEQVVAPLQAVPGAPAERDAALDAMEAAARTLRRFEMEARRLGGGQKFDSLVQRVGTAVGQTAGLSPMDKARLTEILAGTEAAARMLAARGTP